MMMKRTVTADCFGCLRICVNRDFKLPRENLEATDVIAVFVCEEHAIELFRSYATLFEAKNNLARAQSAIDQNLAMIGRDEGTVPGTAAPKHRQTEHERYLVAAFQFSQIKFTRRDKILPPGKARMCFFLSKY